MSGYFQDLVALASFWMTAQDTAEVSFVVYSEDISVAKSRAIAQIHTFTEYPAV